MLITYKGLKVNEFLIKNNKDTFLLFKIFLKLKEDFSIISYPFCSYSYENHIEIKIQKKKVLFYFYDVF